MIFYGFLLCCFTLCASGCASHETYAQIPVAHSKRQSGTNNPGRTPTPWSYYASYDWGRLDPDYDLCQTGTQQSPISLNLNQGLSRVHRPDFTGLSTNSTGTFYNWGYGPAFTLDVSSGNKTDLPNVNFDNETVYLKGWHTHAQADHIVDGYRSKAELHLVLVDANVDEHVVIAIRMDPGRANSNFLPNLPALISVNDTSRIENISWDPRSFLEEVDYLNEFWTYQGSLTSPPCKQGIRWFVARSVLYTGVDQMRQLLRVSSYSARAEQGVWQREINA